MKFREVSPVRPCIMYHHSLRPRFKLRVSLTCFLERMLNSEMMLDMNLQGRY